MKENLAELIKAFLKEQEVNVCMIDMKDDMYRLLCECSNECGLNVDFDISDDGSDCYIYATVYVKDMIGDWYSYNVIINVDVYDSYESEDDFIETVIRLEQEATKVLEHFKK